MSSLLRRLSLTRLLLLCGALIAVGAGGAAVASAIDAGPVPAPEPLPQAIHDAFSAAPVEGVSARIQYTNHLFEGANLAGGSEETGGLASSPLVQGASGRLWVSNDGRVRLELQADGDDTEVVLEDRTVSIYGATPNTGYRYTLPSRAGSTRATGCEETNNRSAATQTSCSFVKREPPTVEEIEEVISRVSEHAVLAGPWPTDIAGQPAYTVRIAPKQAGSLLGAAELSWDAVHGVPLRAAIYSSSSSSPVIELAATEISYGPVENSVFELTPAPGTKIVELGGAGGSSSSSGATGSGHPTVRAVGHGLTSVLVAEATSHGESEESSSPPGTQKVDIDGTTASELSTALGTLLSFERSGTRYLLLGAVKPAAIEAVARGL
jgi:hypothetical protein